MAILGLFWTSLALAADCAPIELPLDGATTLGVRDLSGALTITGVDGDTLRAEGDVCKLHVKSRDGQLFVTGSTTGGGVTLAVPRSLAAVTVYHHRGAVNVSDLPSSRVAAVAIDGSVHASAVPQLRTEGVTGGLTVAEQATAEL